MFARLRPLAPILALAPVLGLAFAPGASRAATFSDGAVLAPKAFVASGVPPIDGLALDTGAPKPPTPEPLAFATDVPEPATWTLMILGFGLVGASARRRRSDAARA